MKYQHTSARTIEATWKFGIIPGNPETDDLYEEAPIDLTTRAIWQLVAPIREFLAEHKHHLEIDRGDFGEGDEFFYITLYDQEDADAFSQLCDDLKS